MTRFDIRVPESGDILAIDGLELARGSVTVLFGPNGAGKTTILRRLAGIGSNEPLVEGSYQPQAPYLFRGLTGWNLGLGLDTEEAARAGDLARRLALGEKLSEPAQNLSGGERQRLALARTLAKNGDWVLLDEPLSAIDLVDRMSVLAVLAGELAGRSAAVVTHDLDVAVALGDQIAVIHGGRLLQQGPLAAVLSGPESLEVARILGLGNVVEGQGRSDGGLTTLTSAHVVVLGSGSVDGPARAIIPGDSVVLGPPSPGGDSSRNRWVGPVTQIRRTASFFEVTVDVGFPLVSVVTPGAADELDLEVGREIMATVKATAVVIVPA